MDVRLGSACALLEPSPHAAIASIAVIAASETTGRASRNCNAPRRGRRVRMECPVSSTPVCGSRATRPTNSPPPGSTAYAIDEQRPSPGVAPTLIVSHAPDIGNGPEKPPLNGTTVSVPASIALEATAGASEPELVRIFLIALATVLVPLAVLYWVFIAGRRGALRSADHRPTGRDEPAHPALNAHAAIRSVVPAMSGRVAPSRLGCVGTPPSSASLSGPGALSPWQRRRALDLYLGGITTSRRLACGADRTCQQTFWGAQPGGANPQCLPDEAWEECWIDQLVRRLQPARPLPVAGAWAVPLWCSGSPAHNTGPEHPDPEDQWEERQHVEEVLE